METLVPIIVQLVAGAVGGGVLGQVLKAVNLGTVGNLIAGALGGVGGTWLATMIPGLDGLVSGAGSMAADGGADAMAGLDMSALLGQGATGLIGGGLLTAIAGLVKNMMGGSKAAS